MYNGIGLKTVRGTGTNGYIQRNLSNVRPRDNPFNKPATSSAPDVRHTQPDAAILEHERKRRVEVRCMELRVQLEDDDVADDEIEHQVQALREKLTAQMEQQRDDEGVSKHEAARLRVGDTHKLAEAKQADERRFARAVGVESGYREGDAFDRELQERKKQERIEERRRRDEERKREWERRKEDQAAARRVQDERDGGWNRGGRTREPTKSVSRSPSPRARKRGKYSASSASHSDSDSQPSARRREGGKGKGREERGRATSRESRSSFSDRSRSRSRSSYSSRSRSVSRSPSASRSRSPRVRQRQSYSRSVSRSNSSRSRSLSRSVSRSRSASLSPTPARALPPGPPPTRPPGL